MKSKKGKTIGDEINRVAREYIDLYEEFRADPEFKEKAKSLAVHDLIMRKYVAEKALEALEKYIKNPILGNMPPIPELKEVE